MQDLARARHCPGNELHTWFNENQEVCVLILWPYFKFPLRPLAEQLTESETKQPTFYLSPTLKKKCLEACNWPKFRPPEACTHVTGKKMCQRSRTVSEWDANSKPRLMGLRCVWHTEQNDTRLSLALLTLT